jgi:hypothetical protein
MPRETHPENIVVFSVEDNRVNVDLDAAIICENEVGLSAPRPNLKAPFPEKVAHLRKIRRSQD